MSVVKSFTLITHYPTSKKIKLCYIGLDKYEKYVSKTVIGNYYKYIGFSYLQKQNYSKAIENYNIAFKYTTNQYTTKRL